MAQRDYVKKNSKAKNNSRVIPKLMIAAVILIIILFAAILYFVATNKPGKPVTLPPAITEKPPLALPDKPEERWTYLKELENPDGNNQTTTPSATQSKQANERQQILNSFINDKPISVAATARPEQQNTTSAITPPSPPTANQVGNWRLQCGAFKGQANAESLKAKLAMLGMTSFVLHDQFYRVFVGPYKLKSDAENTLTTLKNNGITSCIATTK